MMKRILAVLMLISIPIVSYAVVKTVGWDAPTTYSNGEILPPEEISHYRIHWSTTKGGPYTSSIATPDNSLQFQVDFPENNRIYVVLTTVAINGIESDYSAEELAVNLRKPNPPSGLFRN